MSYEDRVKIKPSNDMDVRCNACRSNDIVYELHVGIMCITLCDECLDKLVCDIGDVLWMSEPTTEQIMEYEKELFISNKIGGIYIVKFVGTLPDNKYIAIYYCDDFTIPITHDYKIKGDFFGNGKIKVFTDRKEAYEYAIERKKEVIDDIKEKINNYEGRKYGICTTAIDGITKEHEIDEDVIWWLRMTSENSKNYDEVANLHYDKLFGKQFDEEVEQLKADVIKDMNTYEEYIPDVPAMCNVTIDNISVSCDDVILAAKVAMIIRNHDTHKDNLDYADVQDAINDLKKFDRMGDDD